MRKEVLVFQIAAVVVLSLGLGYMFTYTNVYNDVLNDIVSVTCLSCIKLSPVTTVEFTFDTFKGRPHPDFVLENLSEGPVFIVYRTTVCEFCDVMDPVIENVLNVEHINRAGFLTFDVNYNGTDLLFIHINKSDAPDYYSDSQLVYMKDVFETSVPMFTMVTIGYNRGIVQPYYATAYGILGEKTFEGQKQALTSIIEDGIRLYNENKAGYQ